MARHGEHLLDFHPIVRRPAEAQLLFAFVLGAMAADDTMTVRESVVLFQKSLGIEDLNIKAAIVRYNKMRGEYLRNTNLLKND